MLSFIVFAIGQPLAGKLNDYFSRGAVPAVSIFLVGVCLLLTSRASHIWQVFALFGVGFSLGAAGCSNTVASAIITNWFIKKRGFALGLVTSGMSAGQLIMVPVNLFIIDALGWRTAMMALSIIIMIVVGPLFIFLLRSKPQEKRLMPYGYGQTGNGTDPGMAAPGVKKAVPILSVFKQKAFLQLAIPFFICGFTDVGLIQTHLIPMSEGKGIPVASVAIAFTLIAIPSMLGSIITGHLSDHFSRKRQLAAIYAFRAVTYVLLIALRQPWLLLLFAVLYGIVEMASVAPTNSLAVQLFDGYSTGMILGVVSVSHQIGGAVGSWIPGLLYDLTGSYNVILSISIVMLLGGAWLVLRVPEAG